MFSFGDKDKEKLKENMEQIKEMVDSGDVPAEGSQQPAEGQKEGFPENSPSGNESPEEDFDSQSFDQNDSFDQGWEPAESSEQDQRSETARQNDNTDGQPTQNFGDSQPAEQPASGGQDKIERFEEAAEQNSSFEEPEPAQQQQSSQQTPNNRQPQESQQAPAQEESFDQKFGGGDKGQSNNGQKQSGSSSSIPSNDSIPKPPETKEIEVPEIEKGPLFLKRQKFKRARQMVEEMRYLSEQIEGTLNGLEKGIQEDQNIEKDIRNMLHEFEGSREEVQGIISPGEE